MTVDVIALSLFALAAFLGWRSGAIAQIGRIAAAILAVVGAPYGATVVRDVLFSDSQMSAPAVEASSLFVAGVLIYVSVAVTGWLVVRAMRIASQNLSRLDRLGGGAIGALKGALLVYFVLTVFVLLKVPAEQFDPSNAMRLRGGVAAGFVESHNILAPWQLPDLARLHAALQVGYFAEQLDRQYVLHDHARAADFLRRELIRDLGQDRALMQAVVDDQYALTLADPRVRAALSDGALTQTLSSIDWESLLAEIKSPVHS
jgi:uncharacterized membrane protein required for colicin V production